ncbi:MAG TPA: hypothetical protein VHM00_10455 [Caldimonas sp.]|jgi:hypothetical protein|nr:hypothetical protein [Caldimonas sp.]HEX2541490.1 hypothetical protein [Caldimonas sp.]
MSELKRIVDGLLVSRERLMRAREFYSPAPRSPSPDRAFAAWTERIAVQSELGSAREMAGLSNDELEALEAEFVRSPTRPRPAWVRESVLAGVILLVLACAGLMMLGLTDLGDVASRTLQALSAASLLLGLVPLSIGLLTSFGALHLELSYGTTGLYVGKLDEQHPWLYKAMGLTRHETAEDYRTQTLAARGPLRGMDYILMREMVRVQESLEQMRPARSVSEQLQLLPAPVAAGSPEPRLVHIGRGAERAS